MDVVERRPIEVDGATLEVFLGGAGEPVVCRSHPFGAMSGDAASVWPWESTMGRLVVVNPRGVGGSSPVREPREATFAQHADDLEAVRRHFGIERWVFWGESGGGALGLLYALRHPRALGGLILAYMGPSGRLIAEDDRSVLCPRYSQYRPALAALTADASSRRQARLAGVDPRLAAAWEPLGTAGWLLTRHDEALVVCPIGEAQGPNAEVRAWAPFEEFAPGFDVRERLGEIRVPALVVAGRHDQLVPIDHCELLAAGLPHATYVVLEDSGHGDVDPASGDGERYRAAVCHFLA